MGDRTLASLPSVDRLLGASAAQPLISRFGREPVKQAIRLTLNHIRSNPAAAIPADTDILASVSDHLVNQDTAPLTTVYNLTGTVLHTNLGRASLPENALAAITAVARNPSNLEFDLETAARGDRDRHIESIVMEITGAEAATVVNNNAAAVLLVLNTLAQGQQVLVSRGELIEIGGSFRIPDIMQRAGSELKEVGTTNRTHARDYADAVSPQTALIMKVHTSNYEIRGFTHEAQESDIAAIAHEAELPLVIDLGSGTLTDLSRFGLPREPTVQGALANGADLVTFSGDKLLGGPQAGIVVGRRDLIEQLRANPIKRALRVDKFTIAALHEVLKLYRDPETLPQRLPTLRLLTRPAEQIEQTARDIEPHLAKALGDDIRVTVSPCDGQIGSGALPTDLLPGFGLTIKPGSEQQLQRIAKTLRELPVPVIGRISDGTIVLDVRTIESSDDFIRQLAQLTLS